jgi:hypothetical protein
MTVKHPAGSDNEGKPRKDLWPPPEGTAPAPPENKNPLLKLLMDAASTESEISEDHLLLCNKINMHRCSDYCLRTPKRGFLFSGGAGAVPSGGGHKSFLGFPSLSEPAGCLTVILKLDFAQFDRSIAHSALFFPS